MNPAGVITTLRRALPWLLVALLWLLVSNYRGLVHDAELYTFQALAHRSPELFSGDIYLRHGSQDRFTLFTPIYSAVIEALGVENAAMALTLLAQGLLLFAAWRLARRLTSATLALAGLLFLLGMPTDYGPRRIFQFLEVFATPRMFAEAMVIGALLAILGQRRALAVALLFGGALLHPIMAAPGIAVVAYLWHPQGPQKAIVALSGVALVLVAAIGALPLLDAWRVDPAWMNAFELHADYLFLSAWHATDWTRAATTTLTILLGSWFLPDAQARRLCVAVLLTVAMGFALMLIGVDWLKLAIVVQGQPYRWLWPAGLLATLLLPATVLAMWQRNEAGRGAVLVLAAAWLMRSEIFSPPMQVLTLTLAVLARRGVADARIERWLPRGAALTLAAVVVYAAAVSLQSIQSVYDDSLAPRAINQLRTLCADGFIPAALIIATLWARGTPHRYVAPIAATALLAVGLLLLPHNVAAWSQRHFNAALVAQFGAWRALIPERSEVVWIESPMSSWILLERPSYFSAQQTGSVVFSRAAALELMARERELVPFMLGTRTITMNDTIRRISGGESRPAKTLAEACASVTADYVVSRTDLGSRPVAVAPAGAPIGYRAARLYRCDSKTAKHVTQDLSARPPRAPIHSRPGNPWWIIHA